MGFTRREALAGGAAATGLLLGQPSAAQGTKTRYSATSPTGKAMLVKYARAVDLMRNKVAAGDPRHWDFQWYSHWIPGPQEWRAAEARKAETIARIYGPGPSANRSLAQAMWNGCQAHGDNPANPSQFQTTYFLPWHRYFVYYFEQIVRGVLQDDSFTLPYWDYLGGSVADLCIPPEFYEDRSSPLFQANRNSWVNRGERIDKQNPGTLNLDAFNYRYYISADELTGFCPTLDGNPHGLVHDYTGDPNNMGYVPTAAGDPVFWLHHSNIDRLWASWNRMGNANPVWDNRQFPFADAAGRGVMVTLNGASSTAQLGYGYDAYQQVPASARKVSAAPLFANLAPLAALAPAAVAKGVALSTSRPIQVKLAAPPAAANAMNLMATAPAGGSVWLTLSGIHVMEAFDGAYNVYVGLPEGAEPGGPDSPNYVGTFGSFMFAGHMHHGGGPSLVFDITARVADLTARGQLPASPTVTFAPKGEITAAPTVASVAIVSG
jgi:tyrosinase